MIKVLLDTNFLIYCAKQKIDYLSKINDFVRERHIIIILSPVFSELMTLEKKAKKAEDKRAALLATKLLEDYIKKKIVRIFKTDKKADYAIKEISKKENDIIVATADRNLKKAIKGKAGILSISQKRHLDLR